MKNISINQPVADLNKCNDLFNLYPKANSIKDFIVEYYSGSASLDNKLLAIYGNWGSGKTTLINYLNNEFNNCAHFVPVFFEAWKYEKDNNLSFSLIDVMVSSNNIGNNNNILKTAYSLFKIIGSGVSVNLPGISFNVGNVLDEMDKELEKDASSLSYYKKIESFKASFEELENKVLGNEDDFKNIRDGKKIIVFIDDLDRCDPEKALDLLSDIKHFFTLGKRTIFVVGIDQQAINCAIKAKYQDYINSEEYLEKIFDFTFDISKVAEPKQYLLKYFEGKYDPDVIDEINNLFIKLGFVNPRHVKKILNKFAILEKFFESETSFNTLVPDLKEIHLDKNILNIILVLYFIILYEFYYDKFEEIRSYDEKLSHYANVLYEYDLKRKSKNNNDNEEHTLSISLTESKSTILDYKLFKEMDKFTLKNISDHYSKVSFDYIPNTSIISFLMIFTPFKCEYLSFGDGWQGIPFEYYISQFDQDDILVKFCNYIVKNANVLKNNSSEYLIWDFFKMCRTLL